MTTEIMTKDEILKIIRSVAKEMMATVPSYDADGTYRDKKAVEVILEMNKKLQATVNSLPDVSDINSVDLISRKAEIKELKGLPKYTLLDQGDRAQGVGISLKFAEQTLRKLPSA